MSTIQIKVYLTSVLCDKVCGLNTTICPTVPVVALLPRDECNTSAWNGKGRQWATSSISWKAKHRICYYLAYKYLFKAYIDYIALVGSITLKKTDC